MSPQPSLLAQNVCQHLQLLLLPQTIPTVWEGVLLPLLLRYPTTAKLLPILAILASGMAALASSHHSRLHVLAAVDVIYRQQGCAVLTPARNALVYFMIHAGSSKDDESCAGWPIRLDPVVLSTSSHSNELKSRQLDLSFAACAQHNNYFTRIMGRSSTRLALCDWSLMYDGPAPTCERSVMRCTKLQ
jgi:hypothetical protein